MGQPWSSGLVRVMTLSPPCHDGYGINAARTIFANCWFDTEKCADGIQCLRNYRYDVDPDTQQYSTQPLHDWASHGADAFRYFAVAIKEPKKKAAIPLKQPAWGHR